MLRAHLNFAEIAGSPLHHASERQTAEAGISRTTLRAVYDTVLAGMRGSLRHGFPMRTVPVRKGGHRVRGAGETGDERRWETGMTFLVAGATGTVGRQVVAALREAGAPVRALTRRPGTAAFGPGVEVVGGDLTDAASLASALHGVTAVHLINFGGDDYAPLENGRELVTMIEAAGVRRVTMLAGWSESTLEPAVRASGLAWTTVSPTEIMANALEWADEVRGGRVERPYGDSRTAMVHEGDIGAVAATALLEDGHAGAEYLLTGPERISLREKIAALGSAVDRKVEFVELTPDQARATMQSQGVPEHMIDFQLEVFADPPAEYNTPNGVVEKVTGRPARTFAQWAQENAAAFR